MFLLYICEDPFNSLAPTPTVITDQTDIVEIEKVGNTVFASDSQGTIYGWGENNYGQLGDGTINTIISPLIISQNYLLTTSGTGDVNSIVPIMGSINALTISEVNEFIIENLDEDISLAAISEHVHFNSYYLSRLYKKQAGKSISEYVIEIRLYTAKKYLRQKDMKIRDIVSALGFSDHAYFTRFFKRHEKITPCEYRETHQ